MAKAPTQKTSKTRAVEKQMSITVVPQGPGSQDIHVEVKRNLSAKKRRSQRRFAAFLFGVMFLMLFPMARDVAAYYKMNKDYEGLQQYNLELKAVRQQLEDERESLDSPEMVERLAREELDMVMPGESKVYQAIPTENLPRRENLRTNEVLH
ncbi:MAG: septum formation initiator family protein [Clostridiales bacterium]|nr:septum formation initiator family protein [Clostridiales bacterium]